MRTKNKLATDGTLPKKRQLLVFTLALALMFALGATQGFAEKGDNGQYGGYSRYGGGYSGPGPALVTVEQAKSMRDDANGN